MNNDTTTTENTAPRSSRAVVWILAIALGLATGAGFVLLGGDGDGDSDDGAEVAAVADDAQAEVTDESVQDAPVEEVEEPTPDADSSADEASDGPEVPTVVIGQDEDGNDIVMEIEVTGGCAQTFHRPLDENSFSFIRWSYDAPGIEPGTSVRVSTEAGFEHFTVVTPDYTVVVEQGITAYGDYPFPSLEWNESDDSTVSVDPFENHTVDDREGEASETCLEEAS